MDQLLALIGNYYGLDWATLFLGVTANYLITGGHLRIGFCINVVACTAAFAVATMSGQNGFLVYNVLLIALNLRGILRGDRRKPRALELPAGEGMAPQGAAIPVRAL